jgi:hypothetical protein
MTNEQESLEVTKTAPAPIPLRTSGPYVAVTPALANPPVRAMAVIYAVTRKDLETRNAL